MKVDTRFESIYSFYARCLTYSPEVDVGEWHAQDVSGIDSLVTRELIHQSFSYLLPHSLNALRDDVQPNLPFADAQFMDRVSGEPLNPPPSASLWPYAQRGHEDHLKDGGKFSHTYPERFWPKRAPGQADEYAAENEDRRGIRYAYGDLDDVVEMLAESPYTRQAYLPVWFPEDTGNRGVRLPCSLGYHFLMRNGALDISYYIRSVDFVRHFRDDVYMACRLLYWMLDQLRTYNEGRFGQNSLWHNVRIGALYMHMASLHCMVGDIAKIKRELPTNV